MHNSVGTVVFVAVFLAGLFIVGQLFTYMSSCEDLNPDVKPTIFDILSSSNISTEPADTGSSPEFEKKTRDGGAHQPSNITDAGCFQENPYVAVCLIGNARTLASPAVHRRLRKNLFDSLSRNTFVFAHIKTWDTGVKRQDKFGNFKSIPVNFTSLGDAIKIINATELRIEEKEPSPSSYMNPKCIFTKEAARAKKNQGEFFTRKENTPRYIGQMQSLYVTITNTRNVTFSPILALETPMLHGG